MPHVLSVLCPMLSSPSGMFGTVHVIRRWLQLLLPRELQIPCSAPIHLSLAGALQPAVDDFVPKSLPLSGTEAAALDGKRGKCGFAAEWHSSSVDAITGGKAG